MTNTTRLTVEREGRTGTAEHPAAGQPDSGRTRLGEPAVTADFVCWCQTRRRVYGSMWGTRR